MRQPYRVRRGVVVHDVCVAAKWSRRNSGSSETNGDAGRWGYVQRRRVNMGNQNNPNQNPGQQSQNPSQK
nr:hypothetical protein [Afipia sp.]